MEIKYGGTRIVILFDKFVIKIPRVRIFKLVKRIFIHTRNGDIKNKINEHKINIVFVLKNFLLCGFIANWNEYKYSKNHKGVEQKSILKVMGLLFGFIEIQERGHRVYPTDPIWKKLKILLRKNNIKDHDCFLEQNYSFIDGNICLHDYGESQTLSEIDKVIKILNKYNKKSLVT